MCWKQPMIKEQSALFIRVRWPRWGSATVLLAEISGGPRVRLHVPHWVAHGWAYVDVSLARLNPRGTPAATPDKVRLSRRYEFFDSGRAVRELGLPQTPARVALRKAVEWYKSNGYVR